VTSNVSAMENIGASFFIGSAFRCFIEERRIDGFEGVCLLSAGARCLVAATRAARKERAPP
jgi:hypothetical protein